MKCKHGIHFLTKMYKLQEQDGILLSAGPLAGVRGWMRLILLAKSGSRGTRADRGSAPQFLRNSQNWKTSGMKGCKPATHKLSQFRHRSEMPGDLRRSDVESQGGLMRHGHTNATHAF